MAHSYKGIDITAALDEIQGEVRGGFIFI